MKIFGIETSKKNRRAAKKKKADERAAATPGAAVRESYVGTVLPTSTRPPIYPLPPAPDFSAAHQSTRSLSHHPPFRLSTKDIDLPVMNFSEGIKPEGSLSVLLGFTNNEPELTTTPADLLTSHLPDKTLVTATQSGSSLEPMIAAAYASITEQQLEKLMHPAEVPEPRYPTTVGKKTVDLRFDQILAIIALRQNESVLFGRVLTFRSIRGNYLDDLKEVTGNPKIVGSVPCVFGGALASASLFFDSGKTLKYAKLGTDLLRMYFENIDDIAILARREADEEIDEVQPKFNPLKEYSKYFLQTIVDGLRELEDKEPAYRDQEYTRASMQLGAYTAMVYQAAVEHAASLTKDAKRKAKIITICADLAVVGITGAVASHFPPVLAVIPAALTFVSTHLVPYFVPNQDFRTAVVPLRATMKASSIASITQPIVPREDEQFEPRPPTIFEMQQRRFYHDMFFSAWDILPDTRPAR